MSLKKAVSIVVPTLNESDNIAVLVNRIDLAFENTDIKYEIVFVDDRSSDGTQTSIKKLQKKYPISLLIKDGPRGKAYSLLQGFKHAKYETICMIDADLQYPPEAIIPMYRLIDEKQADMIITRREEHDTSKVRQLSSKTFNLIFTKMLFGFDYDSQSGLKLFKRDMVKSFDLNPTPWSFDLEFIVRGLENNYKILSYGIPFSNRHSGKPKVKLAQVTYELAKASVQLKMNSSSKKVKQGYRQNLEFSKKVLHGFSMVIVVLGLLGNF